MFYHPVDRRAAGEDEEKDLDGEGRGMRGEDPGSWRWW